MSIKYAIRLISLTNHEIGQLLCFSPDFDQLSFRPIDSPNEL